ncbi:uncharacterized protein SCHCODRAFT_01203806 [Schizophyllum commune H4-8]|uniref:uncharacterized protein n=1 Tax=Schizophyllum commune (strain H4-8 / FGSC 9210) TaxID=578458 RepID=UPI00215F66E9|nr:uncharacterized protein SCHCODRAFT_01203806 [Schizophyllum commune H4-8]KAI5889838.1 hypothetical protein SCHCODRAFT_01203806 [Schizophyllum commune H4-8]
MPSQTNAENRDLRYAPYPGGNRNFSRAQTSSGPSLPNYTNTEYNSVQSIDTIMHSTFQDELCARVGLAGVDLGLSPEIVEHAQLLSKVPLTAEGKVCLVGGEFVAIDARIAQLTTDVEEIKRSILNIEALVRANWVVSTPLHIALSQVVSYHASKPTHSINRILKSSVKYVLKHAAEYELETTGPMVAAGLELHIASELLNQRKNKVRTLIFANTVTKTSLDLMSLQIVNKFWVDPKPKKTEISRATKAHFALMREIAAPSAAKTNVRGGDTGFWKNLNAALFQLYTTHGEDRTTAGWLAWQDEKIAADMEKYNGLTVPEIGLGDEEVEED